MPGILVLRKYFQGSPSSVTHSFSQQIFFRYFYILTLSASVNSSAILWSMSLPDLTVTLLKIPEKSGVEMGRGQLGTSFVGQIPLPPGLPSFSSTLSLS